MNELQESKWEQPDGNILYDASAPKTPSQTMDLALANTNDKKAFRAAKREAENCIALLMRTDELPEPEGLIDKLNSAVAKLQMTLPGEAQ